jgi:glucans biosynthesis protein
MFQTGENDRRMANDWRPEIHDSDGLQMWTGSGEWIWRPLHNPASLRFSAFADQTPRGFGLLQRDRDFTNYQDDGVFYDKPAQPVGRAQGRLGAGRCSWSRSDARRDLRQHRGAVEPAAPAPARRKLLFAYRMHWGAQPPFQSGWRTGRHADRIGGIVWAAAQVLLVALRDRLRRRRARPARPESQGRAGHHHLARPLEITSARRRPPSTAGARCSDLVVPLGMEPIDLRL